MLPVSRRACLLDAPSITGRCSVSHVAFTAPQRLCKRVFCAKAADVAQPATFPNNTEPQTAQLIPSIGTSQQQQQQQQQVPQQPQQRSRQRLFGGSAQNGSGSSSPQQLPAQQQPSAEESLEAVQQQLQRVQWTSWQASSSSNSSSNSSSSSLASADFDDVQQQLHSERAASGAQASSSSSSRSSSSRPYLLNQQPQHPQHTSQQQQRQQQWQEQQLMAANRSLRTVQWYRDQANKRLTQRITKANDLAGLRQLMRQYEGTMNHIHINALFVRLVKLVASRQLRPLDMLSLSTFLPQVLSLVAAGVPDYNERAISNTLHGLAVLELSHERKLISSLLAAAETIQLSSFKPQGLANTAWALATLHINPGPRLTQQLLAASAAVMSKFKPQELAQLGWAVGTLRLRVAEPWVQGWRGAVDRVFDKLNPQGMSMVLWAAARMWEFQEPSQQQQLLLMQQQQLQQQRPLAAATTSSSTSSSSSGGISALTGLQEWLMAAERSMLRRVGSFTPHSFSICLWAFGRLGHQPSRGFTAAALEAVQPQLGVSARPVDLAVFMYSLAALYYRPSWSWMEAHGAAVARVMGQLTIREVSNMLWAHGRLGLRPADARVLPGLMDQLYYGMQDANARDLANSLWALAALGETPPRNWMGIFGAQAEAVVHDFTPQEVANLLWAYAKLHHKPPAMLLVALWEGVGVGSSSAGPSTMLGASPGSSAGSMGSSLGAPSDTSARLLSSFKPQELSMLVWALAVLRVVPGKGWWDQFLQASFHKMSAQSPQSLSNIIWALSELQLQPPPAWLYHWAAAARAALPVMSPIDLGQVAAALQGPTFEPLGLPKLETLLLDVLDQLAAVELQSGAYSKAAVELLMRMPSSSSSSSGVGSGSNSSSSSSSSGTVGISRIGSSGRPRIVRLSKQQQQQQQLAGDNSSSGAAAAAVGTVQGVLEVEVQQLKQQLSSHVESFGSDSEDDMGTAVAATSSLYDPDSIGNGYGSSSSSTITTSSSSSGSSRAAPAAV